MKRLLAGEAALLLTIRCLPGAAQVTFRGFDVQDAGIDDMSADGSVVVGRYARATATAFRWTAAGIEDIGGDMDRVRVSRDGKTVVGAALDAQGNRNAAIWMGGKNWKLLGGVPGGAPSDQNLSAAYDVSADGSVIVGTAYKPQSQPVAFRWDPQHGMVDLGAIGDGTTAWAVSADGNVTVGYDHQAGPVYIPYDGRHGTIFWAGTERLLHPFGYAGEARATNQVGSIIVGRFHPENAYTPPKSPTTYLYTSWDGKFEDLGAASLGTPPLLQGEQTSNPQGVSDDGSVVVGDTGFSQKVAALWTRETGMVTVYGFLTSKGVTNHVGWTFTVSTYVSPDGKAIAGACFNPANIFQSWIVTLP
jgi:probable HAF family extracellular repeat protein